MGTLPDFHSFWKQIENQTPDSEYWQLSNELFDSLHPELLALEAIDGPFPEVLCHYTDFVGLKGILSSSSLWFTYAKTLNDSVEQEHGRALIAEYLEKRLAASEMRQLMIAGTIYQHSVFVCCFCESSSVLAMWKNYASLGGGYCLEFDTSALRTAFAAPVEPVLLKMTYSSALSDAVTALLDKVGDFGQIGVKHAVVAGFLLNMLPLKFKHPAFSDERERRMMISNPDASILQFRQGHSDIKPYIQASSRAATNNSKLPLKRVVFGPTLRDDGVVAEVISLMLKRYGYVDVSVAPSRIPFRL